jgi:outer membrane lipoprotein carrier protein
MVKKDILILKKILLTITCAIIFNINTALATPLETIEDYFNNLTTFQADFRQFTVNIPGVSEGQFYIQRPKQFLWQYNYPHQQKIVSTGTGAYFFDPDNGQTTQIPVNSGFASIFTQKKISFNSKEFKVTKQSDTPESLEITLSPTEDSDISEISFVLQKKPLHLQQIISKDAFGDTTIVVFSAIEEKVELDKELFKFVLPHYENE